MFSLSSPHTRARAPATREMSFDVPVHESLAVRVTRLVPPPPVAADGTVCHWALRVRVVAEAPHSHMSVARETAAELRGEQYRGAYYAFLMTHTLPGKKKDANVAYGTNPFHEIYRHNAQLVPDRATSQAAPHWILDIVLGPFCCANEAVACASEWVTSTRGKEPKRRKAYTLMQRFGVALYSYHVPHEPPGVDDFLRTRAPRRYVHAYRTLRAKIAAFAAA